MLTPPARFVRGSARIARVSAALLAGALLASCAAAPTPSSRSKEYFSEAETGVASSPRVVAYGQPVPKGGGRYMVGKPYRVSGRTYVPRENPNYSATGFASWYGSAFHGRRTANGEVYDMRDLTAAHPTLPLPSYVRVTNLSNGRSVVVRVNDRGPFKRNRVIDVSSTVAEVLDFKRSGTARVKVDYVGPARMDGNDRRMLLATYRGPGRAVPGVPDTMLASARPTAPARSPVVLASAPTPRSRPADFGAGEPMALAPSPASLTLDDPLAPLILRTGFASSYLPTDRFTPAQSAAADLAAAADRAAATGPVVQVGTFADPANAARAGRLVAAYGTVAVAEAAVDGRAVNVVRVTVAGGSDPAAVIDAARAAGLDGAFVVR
jgi:rare lipoprotein A